jgi:hypothetical protein
MLAQGIDTPDDITRRPLPLSLVQDAMTRLGFHRIDIPDAILFREEPHRASVRLPRLADDDDVIPPYLNAIRTTVVGRGVTDANTFNALLMSLANSNYIKKVSVTEVQLIEEIQYASTKYNIDALKVIDQLEAMVEQERMKFLGFVRLDEDAYFQLTSKLRASLPEDIRRAGRLAENTDKLMESAQVQADKAMEQARIEAERIRAEAQREGERLILEAQREAERIRLESSTQANRAIEEAEAVSRNLTDQSEINRIATVQAREIRSQAEREAQEIRDGADAYARDVLLQLEQHIEEALHSVETRASNLLGTVQRGRMSLERNLGSSISSEPTVIHSRRP